MRNFKLLIATTAVLSTTLAMGANATEPTAEVEAHIGLYEANKITVLEDMEFGTLLDTGRTEEATVIVSLNPNDDDFEITGSGVETAGDYYHNAYVAVNVPVGYTSSLSLPDSEEPVILTNDDGYGVLLTPAYSYDTRIQHGNYQFDYYKIGGTISLTGIRFGGDYRGSFVITALIEEDPDYAPEP